ncbi:MAG: PEP/pyruvate-binding domain-containing protein [Acidobacteriota bacterium]
MKQTLSIGLLAAVCVNAQGLVAPMTPQQITQAAKILQQFEASPKGPYFQIRWFCKDGTVYPPAGVPCREHGGGVQHADLTAQAKQLAAWGIDLGTVLVALPFDEAFDPGRDHWRLKELILEAYLADVKRGWIYAKAVNYRGARQIEDEEKAGRALLTRLLSDPSWTKKNYFVASQLVSTLPHGFADSRVKRIRNLATALADLDSKFQPVRAKIHSIPGPDDVGRVEEYVKNGTAPEASKALLDELLTKLREQYTGRDSVQAIPKLPPEFRDRARTLGETRGTDEWLKEAAAISLDVRKYVEQSKSGAANLTLLDWNEAILDHAFAMTKPQASTRRDLLGLQRQWFAMATGAGLLSMRQYDALHAELGEAVSRTEWDPEAWRRMVLYVARAAEWSRATVARDFGPVGRHWGAVEPVAVTIVDHLLRSSVALPMTASLDTLVRDGNRAAGIVHTVFGKGVAAGVAGLNPGVAVGKLRIIRDPVEAAGNLDPKGVYVLPETVSDLKPVAGILTLDSGNALSHTQILAANLGIPNATVPSSLLDELEKHNEREVFYAVTPRNVVVLRETASLNADERKLWVDQPATAQRARIQLDTSRLNLESRKLILLSSLRASDSGALAGPKAANLGELASYFPKEVAPGLVIPFGIYYAHFDRVLDGGGKTFRAQIEETFAEVERMRDQGAPAEAINKFMQPKLAAWRKTLQTMPLLPDFEAELTTGLERLLGPDKSYGAFVRSDTNAEDLPEFTGAGLNKTIPNVVGVQNILAAVREVWASPYSDRAFEWRNRALKGSERVYPSVIVMRSVPSDKSGVIATVNLETGARDETTVNVSEGTSAVVDGGVAESLLLMPGDKVKLLQQARVTYRRVVLPTGGFANLPPIKDDYLLTADEIVQLRAMVADVQRKYPAVKGALAGELPWDIEFGFEKGALRLFQIRPLVRYQEVAVLQQLTKLEGRKTAGMVKVDAAVMQ